MFPQGLEFRDSMTGETFVALRSITASTRSTMPLMPWCTAPTCSM